MTTPELFPRAPKRLRQPRKEVLREQLRLAADRIIALTAEVQSLRRMFGLSAKEAEEALMTLSEAFRVLPPIPSPDRWWHRIPILNLLKKES